MQNTKEKVRYLRQESTKAEKILWRKIRNRQLGVKFRRQHPIGNYVLDFYAPEEKFCIELDGSEHKENTEYDNERTGFLNSKKIKVLRFWNHEIEQNLDKVIDKIKKYIVG